VNAVTYHETGLLAELLQNVVVEVENRIEEASFSAALRSGETSSPTIDAGAWMT